MDIVKPIFEDDVRCPQCASQSVRLRSDQHAVVWCEQGHISTTQNTRARDTYKLVHTFKS